MASDDAALINRHMEELHQEVTALRDALDQTVSLEREATLQDVYEALRPAIDALVALEAGAEGSDAEKVVEMFSATLPVLGLTPRSFKGELLELWPEEANLGFTLDRSIPKEASLARVKVLARGWSRGRKLIARPRGVALEVIDKEREREKC